MAGKKKEPEVSREPIKSTWRGVDRWECPFCPRDSESERAIRGHIDVDHPIEQPHPLAPATPEESANGTAATDENGRDRTVPDRGGDGH